MYLCDRFFLAMPINNYTFMAANTKFKSTSLKNCRYILYNYYYLIFGQLTIKHFYVVIWLVPN